MSEDFAATVEAPPRLRANIFLLLRVDLDHPAPDLVQLDL